MIGAEAARAPGAELRWQLNLNTGVGRETGRFAGKSDAVRWALGRLCGAP